jgi:hypothetical protein
MIAERSRVAPPVLVEAEATSSGHAWFSTTQKRGPQFNELKEKLMELLIIYFDFKITSHDSYSYRHRRVRCVSSFAASQLYSFHSSSSLRSSSSSSLPLAYSQTTLSYLYTKQNIKK